MLQKCVSLALDHPSSRDIETKLTSGYPAKKGTSGLMVKPRGVFRSAVQIPEPFTPKSPLWAPQNPSYFSLNKLWESLYRDEQLCA